MPLPAFPMGMEFCFVKMEIHELVIAQQDSSSRTALSRALKKSEAMRVVEIVVSKRHRLIRA